MKRFTPTRSLATAVMALSLCATVTLAALVPVAGVRPATLGYVAMLVTGLGMFLRERVFAAATTR